VVSTDTNCPTLQDDEDKEQEPEKGDAHAKKAKDKKTVDKKKEKVSFPQQHEETDNKESEPETQFLSFSFCNTSSDPVKLRNMILLDNQSTVDLFCKRKLVSRVWETTDSMTVHGNGGTLTTNKKAYVLRRRLV
jgi:hypothetical protein